MSANRCHFVWWVNSEAMNLCIFRSCDFWSWVEGMHGNCKLSDHHYNDGMDGKNVLPVKVGFCLIVINKHFRWLYLCILNAPDMSLKCLCNEIFMLKKITLMWSLRLLISIVKVLERIIERKYVSLTFEKRDFTQKIETYFIPQLMTSSRSSTWIFIVIEKTVQNTV